MFQTTNQFHTMSQNPCAQLVNPQIVGKGMSIPLSAGAGEKKRHFQAAASWLPLRRYMTLYTQLLTYQFAQYLYIYKCICICVQVYIFIYLSIYLFMYLSIYVCIHACIQMCYVQKIEIDKGILPQKAINQYQCSHLLEGFYFSTLFYPFLSIWACYTCVCVGARDLSHPWECSIEIGHANHPYRWQQIPDPKVRD